MATIVDSFLATVKQYPDLPAVEDQNGAYTYAQVDVLSNLIADELLRIFAGDTTPTPLPTDTNCRPVAVVLSRRKETLPAFLGVLRSGNCYVFSAPDAPAERLDYILKDAGISCVITEKDAPLLTGRSVLYVEDILARFTASDLPGISHHVPCASHDPAYITYTSGSTGLPKGVVDTYAYIDNHNRARHMFYTPEPGECIGNIVSFSYAASTYDLFSGLLVGCNLYIFSNEELLNQSVLVSRVIDHNITTMFMIPSMIPVVFAPGVELPIRWVITAGEKARKVPEISAEIAEIYGSSEAAAVTGRVISPDDPWDLLGKPIPGTELFLIDEKGELITTPGEVGDLCIVNDALALGYLNRPEETKEKFRPCPFRQGKRMLVSGDMMRFDADGNYYTCGRRDNMTKINGQRVEMGEIEAAIVRHSAVEDAVCGVVTRNRAAILVCWYLLKAGEKELTPKELESFTSEKLPRYMVPAYWVQLDFFPKNINGKVDRKALPEPDFDRFSLMEPPQDYLEEKFLEIAQRMMPDIRFGVTDDLLSLGMDSILAVQYVSEVEKYDPRITVSDVLRLKNIREILTAPKTIGWFYKEYDAAKPIIVLIHGIVPVSGFSRLCALWEESFNLFVIEPFPDHIMQEVGRYDYDALIACYTELLKRELPEQAILWGFAGFSFGGQLAVSMADAWQKRTGEQKTVLMGDTLMHWIYPGKTFHRLTEDDPYIRMVTERGKKYGDSAVNEPLEITLKKQNAVIDLLNTVHENIKYEGPVWYLDAKMDYDDPTEQIKLAVVQSLYPKLRLFHFPKLFHNDLYLLNDEMIRFYQNLFLSEGVNPEYI